MSTTATPEERRLYIREFLNNPGHHSLGAVLAEISDGDDADDYLDFGATLQIQDCSRSVTLDFGVYGQVGSQKDRDKLRADVQNARHKAEVLKGAIYKFVDMLDEALTDVEENLNERDLAALATAKKKAAKKAKKKAAKKTQQEG
jgi:hypothetical protein